MTLLLCLGAVMTISLMIVDNVAMSRNGACDMWLGFKVHSYLEAHTLPLFLGRLLFKITDPNHKTRYPKKGVGYEPLGMGNARPKNCQLLS